MNFEQVPKQENEDSSGKPVKKLSKLGKKIIAGALLGIGALGAADVEAGQEKPRGTETKNSGGARWEPLPPEPLPKGAIWQPLPPERKEEQGAASFGPIPNEKKKEEGAASFGPIPEEKKKEGAASFGPIPRRELPPEKK